MKSESKKIHEGGGSGYKSVFKLGPDGQPLKYKRHKKHEHHHHQHKEKKVRKVPNENDDLDNSLMIVPIKREDHGSAPAGVSDTSKQALKKLLDHFLHHLQRRDSSGHFAHPVNPADAPGKVLAQNSYSYWWVLLLLLVQKYDQCIWKLKPLAWFILWIVLRYFNLGKCGNVMLLHGWEYSCKFLCLDLSNIDKVMIE